MTTTRRNFLKCSGISIAAALGTTSGAFAATEDRPLAGSASLGLPARAVFPGVEGRVFLNSAATHPWGVHAADAMKKYTDERLAGRDVFANAAGKFAQLVNADPENVTYVPSTSMGEYLVTRALGLPESGGRVVTDALHFVGSFYMYEQYRKQGLDVVTIPMDEHYRITPESLDHAIVSGTRLVAISHVSLYNGFTHDLKAVCDLAHSRGALVYVDLIQSAGAIPVDLKASGVDFAACGTYKWLMGDFGFAFLYVRKELLPRLRRPWLGYFQTNNFAAPLLHVYPMDPPGPTPYESSQKNTVGGYFSGALPALGPQNACAASLDWIQSIGVPAIDAYRQPMLSALQSGLREKGFQVVTPPETRAPIVTFAYKDASRLAPRLSAAKVEITLRANHARISPSVFNTMSDIDTFLAAIGTP
ncbi:aminotransferase class V-fold PLP-dependent enzyme [Paraburkholderia caballeronis]|uniref:Selenocysteine lyase/Cysteine desulfurase n=1 Tax=Paraburkholderia caballeronis TaxID=416943 RepID=A0A1H7TT63_9BURK|nr:aminotransferase class V-fold PLP-dependent enzyme [Paraburkholderia caballeronis]PXW17632.1 selenocysteine lyase/cysteine desulfurase [Paraburkholderia caballeronis]PXW95377.1 selenocysteine lyase/cysteine desulfurase [Paraburkholderia caballeronis]RAJ91191.1 selenocysteine lyase/cysteine desulfurase [Paraburkholderia caballeronis]SEE13549.1 Selenocysteine lyase/Cysteine desulfurase [Paraburkholderia caballeronis]SEL87689.1 Selenocysteine lyase/Cysteine desulfurase [Paraburkholderia caball